MCPIFRVAQAHSRPTRVCLCVLWCLWLTPALASRGNVLINIPGNSALAINSVNLWWFLRDCHADAAAGGAAEQRCRSTPNRTETHPASSLPNDWRRQRDDAGACQCRRAPDIVRRLRLGGSQVAGLARAHARASAGPSVASLAILKRAHRPTVRFCARIPALLQCNQCLSLIHI